MKSPSRHRYESPDPAPEVSGPIRVLDRAAARAIDQAAISQLNIPGILLMEHAAQSVMLVVEQIRLRRGIDEVIIVCGPGNNGGDGYALARLLTIARIDTTLIACGSPREGSDAAKNAAICEAMKISIHPPHELARLLQTPKLIVDAIFGTGLDRPIEGDAADMIQEMNAADSPILAVDLPSGLDADTGIPTGPCIRAESTITFVAIKPAMLVVGSEDYLGEVSIGDIGTPRSLLEEYGTVVHPPGGGPEPAPRPAPHRRGS